MRCIRTLLDGRYSSAWSASLIFSPIGTEFFANARQVIEGAGFRFEFCSARLISEASHRKGDCDVSATLLSDDGSAAPTSSEKTLREMRCGDPAPIAGHKEALVKEHYETGTIDRERMRSLEAVQSECPTCSAREGADLNRYSREKRKELGL